MLWVKICGITTPAAARAAAQAGASAVGFVFWPRSRRYVDPERAAALAAELPPGVARVGVFVDEPLDRVVAAARAAGLTHVQLHGAEPPEYLAGLPLPAIKAVRLRGPQDLAGLAAYVRAPGCWAILAEAHVPHTAGGAGVPLDLPLARQARDAVKAAGGRFILAGGLDPASVAQAVAAVAPDGVDVSSGVETGGEKDAEKIYAFVANARGTHL